MQFINDLWEFLSIINDNKLIPDSSMKENSSNSCIILLTTEYY
jgi:hypothetical protein